MKKENAIVIAAALLAK